MKKKRKKILFVILGIVVLIGIIPLISADVPGCTWSGPCQPNSNYPNDPYWCLCTPLPLGSSCSTNIMCSSQYCLNGICTARCNNIGETKCCNPNTDNCNGIQWTLICNAQNTWTQSLVDGKCGYNNGSGDCNYLGEIILKGQTKCIQNQKVICSDSGNGVISVDTTGCGGEFPYLWIIAIALIIGGLFLFFRNKSKRKR